LQTVITFESIAEMRAEARAQTEILARLGDDVGLAKAWGIIGDAHWFEGQGDAAGEAWTKSAAYAESGGDARRASEYRWCLLGVASEGPMPATEAIRLCGDYLTRAGDGDPILKCAALSNLSALAAMRARFGEAKEFMTQARTIMEDLGRSVESAASTMYDARVEKLSGDLLAAERHLRRGYEKLRSMGEKAYCSSVAAELSLILCALGRLCGGAALGAPLRRGRRGRS
jgi:hypothetical protein